MSLAKRCETLSKDIERLSTLKTSYGETQQLRTKAVLLTYYKTKTTDYLSSTCIFRGEDIIITPPDIIDGIRNNLERIEDNFSKNPTSQSLTKRNYWTSLESGFKDLDKAYNKAILASWQKFVQTALPKETPSNLEKSTIKTTDNTKYLQQYRTVFQLLESLKKELPANAEAFQRVREFGIQLADIYSKIDRDVPEDVGKFLTAINVGNGAPLDLLTEEVIAWLKRNNVYKDYKITM